MDVGSGSDVGLRRGRRGWPEQVRRETEELPMGKSPTGGSIGARSVEAVDDCEVYRDIEVASDDSPALHLSKASDVGPVRCCSAIPPLEDYLVTGSSYVSLSQRREFEDLNLSSAAAGFVTFLPITMLFRRWPFRIFILSGAAYFTTYAVLHGFEVIEVDVGEAFLPFVVIASAVPACILWVTPVVAVYWNPRWATVLVGCAFISNAILLCASLLPPALIQDQPTRAAHRVLVTGVELMVAFPFLFKEHWWWRAGLVTCATCFVGAAFFLVVYDYHPTVRQLFLPAAIWICMVLLFLFVRFLSLRHAFWATKPDQIRYNNVWSAVKEESRDELLLLAELVKTVENKKVLLPFLSLEVIYQHAHALDDWYQAIVVMWAVACGARAHDAPPKSLQRTLEKANRSYKGDFRRVCDILRSTIVVDDIGDFAKVLRCIMGQVVMHVIKNRFDFDYDSTITAGYRDVNCQFSFRELEGTVYEGFVFELQIHFAPILALKSDEGHQRYIRLRNLRGD